MNETDTGGTRASTAPLAADEPAYYEITVNGRLDSHWSEWFDGLTIMNNKSGYTKMAGCIPDQAALHGILARIRDLGLPLLSLNLIDPHRGICYTSVHGQAGSTAQR